MTGRLVTLEQAARMLRHPTRDHSYQQTRLGPPIRAYLAWKRMSRAADRTLDQYERDLARMAIALADREIRDVTSADLLLVLEHFPVASRRRALAAISGFFRWAVSWDRVDRNPVDRLPSMRAEPTKVYDIFDPAENARIAAAQAGSLLPERDRLGVLIFEELGIRKSEALGIRLLDFDVAGRTVVVTGKGSKQRVVPFTDSLFTALIDFTATPIAKARHRDERGVWLEDRDPLQTDFVFFPSGATGAFGDREPQLLWTDPARPMAQSSLHRWWERTIARSGVRYRSLHMNRHTVGTELVEADVDSFTVRDWLGHADTRTTEVYVHNARGRLQRAVAKRDQHRKGDA